MAGDWATEVDDSAEAVLCHRDLHPDNILPNAISQAWEPDYADRARGHLIDLVAEAR